MKRELTAALFAAFLALGVPADQPKVTLRKDAQDLVNADKIRISQSLVEKIKNEYDPDTEKYWILLANSETGAIEKATSQWTNGSRMRCTVEPGFHEFLDKKAKKEGYFIVGDLHTHPPTPRGPTGDGGYNAGDMLSRNDYGGHFQGAPLKLLLHPVKGVFALRAFATRYAVKDFEISPTATTPTSAYNGDQDNGAVEFLLEETTILASPDFDAPGFMNVTKATLPTADYIRVIDEIYGARKRTRWNEISPNTECTVEVKARYDGQVTVKLRADGWTNLELQIMPTGELRDEALSTDRGVIEGAYEGRARKKIEPLLRAAGIDPELAGKIVGQ